MPPLHEIKLAHPQASESERDSSAFRALFTYSSDAIVIIDDQGRYTEVNPVACELFGVSHDELLGKRVFDFVPPMLTLNAQHRWRRLTREGADQGELTIQRPDGTQRTLEYSATSDFVSGLNLAIMRDITVEKAVARQQTALFRLSTGLLKLSAPADIANALLAESLEGLSARSGLILNLKSDADRGNLLAIRNLPEEMIDPLRALPFWGDEALFLESGSEIMARFPEMRPFVEHIGEMALIMAPIKIGDRAVAGLGLTFDSRQCFSRELRNFVQILLAQASQALERAEATAVRDEFLSVASHELATPVTSVKIQAELMVRAIRQEGFQNIGEARIRRMIDVTERQIRKLTALITDLLDVSCIASGKLPLQPTEVDLSAIVQETIDRFQDHFTCAQCIIVIDRLDSAPGFWDPRRMEEVVINLLSNACKYGKGKPVHLSLRLQSDDRVELSVRDEGIGIAKENQARIFGRFERAIRGSSISGFGLGLYLVKEIVESHSGTIRVNSDPGEGATFTVELPRRPDYH